MSVFIYKFLFSYYPYIVICIFLMGSIYRYETNQYSWKSGSSQILENKLLFWGSNLFHIGIIFLLFGHFFGLMTPKFLYIKLIAPENKQIVAMITGGIAGFFCFIGMSILIYRRLFNIRVLKTSHFSDLFILIMLYLQLLLGLFSIYISYQHGEDASSMISLANWVQGIFIFSDDIYLHVINEHWIFQLHLFLGMSIFLIFPFTRLVHIFSFPYLYFLRNGYQIIRSLK